MVKLSSYNITLSAVIFAYSVPLAGSSSAGAAAVTAVTAEDNPGLLSSSAIMAATVAGVAEHISALHSSPAVAAASSTTLAEFCPILFQSAAMIAADHPITFLSFATVAALAAAIAGLIMAIGSEVYAI